MRPREWNPLRQLPLEHSMALIASNMIDRSRVGMAYAWSGFAVMWAFWVSFVIFLCEPRRLAGHWPLPTVDQGGGLAQPWAAALVDLGLIALFGLQHSLMARPWFKRRIMSRMAPAFERCTYVHMANLALFALILGWQPVPVAVWNMQGDVARNLMWLLFALGWITLLFGAWSFGLRELLGIEQMRAWANGQRPPSPRLKTSWLYRWTRHPMYVGVLLAVWATPRMSLGHALLALGLTGYVLIALRYEERDLLDTFGSRYRRWREAAN